MSLKIIPFKPENATDGDTIQLIEKILEKAKAGDVVGIALATRHKDSSIGTAWSTGCRDSVFGTLGAIEYLKYRFTKEEVE